MGEGYVMVERLPFGSSYFQGATVDKFEGDTLTITVLETKEVWTTIPAGSWLVATAYDRHGHPLFHFTSLEQDSRALETQARLKELNAKYAHKGAA